MSVFNDGLGNIYHTDGSRVVWSTPRKPALLLPASATTITGFQIQFPDLAKSNGYGFNFFTDPISGITSSSCVSFVTINPQEWDSGLSHVCDLPAGSNYFEVEVSLAHIVVPSTFLGAAIPDVIAGGVKHMPDGNAAIVEAIGPLIRMFAFERVGNSVYLRRRQSVTNGGQRVDWNSPNDNNSGGGGLALRAGWTYDGDPNAWAAHILDSNNVAGVPDKRRGTGYCSLVDTTNYASLWQGTVTVTPGYIEP
jgi:hypothetical protein